MLFRIYGPANFCARWKMSEFGRAGGLVRTLHTVLAYTAVSFFVGPETFPLGNFNGCTLRCKSQLGRWWASALLDATAPGKKRKFMQGAVLLLVLRRQGKPCVLFVPSSFKEALKCIHAPFGVLPCARMNQVRGTAPVSRRFHRFHRFRPGRQRRMPRSWHNSKQVGSLLGVAVNTRVPSVSSPF